MKISRNKKILVTAITVFSISAIGITINALTGAFSLDAMSRDEKYMTDAFIARAGDEKDEYVYEDEFEDEVEASMDNPDEEKSSDIDAVTSATPDTDEPGGAYTAGDEVLSSQGNTAVDIESSATPRTGSAAAVTGIKPGQVNPSAPGAVPAPGADIVSSATPRTGSAAAEPGTQPAPDNPGVTGIVPDAGADIVSSATPKGPSAGSPSTSSPSSPEAILSYQEDIADAYDYDDEDDEDDDEDEPDDEDDDGGGGESDDDD